MPSFRMEECVVRSVREAEAMSGIQGIGPIYGGTTAGQMAPMGRPAGQTADGGKIGGAVGGSSVLSLSSTSVAASSETLLAVKSPMLATNEAIGAALLMLILQYLQANDAKEKQELTAMIVALAGMQQNKGAGELLFYSSSSLSIQSTQLTMATSGALDAYSGASASLQQAPQSDAGAAGLNVTA
jgi:hypothetical protein